MTPTTATPVTFDSAGDTLVGTLHRPHGAAERLPGIVVTGTWTSVKEQMAERYAQRLAGEGFAALAFDFRTYGESGGTPRNLESAAMKSADIHAAVGFLVSRPEINGDGVGALGICASAGYTVQNTVVDNRVKALALVAPWLHDAPIVEQVYGGADGVRRRMDAGRAALTRFEATGEVAYVPAISDTVALAPMPLGLDFYENPERGGIPQWPNRFAVQAWPEWLTYDPVRLGRFLDTPLVMVHSEDAAVPAGAHRFFDAVPAAKDQLWIDGTQLDFYDQEPQVGIAVRAAAGHFRQIFGRV